jgi:hypothetical protein
MNRPIGDRPATPRRAGSEAPPCLRALLRHAVAQHVPCTARIRARVELAAPAHACVPVQRTVTVGHCR